MHIAHKEVGRYVAQVSGDTLLHLACGAVCESDAQHLAVINRTRGMKHTPGEDVCLSTSRSGEYESRGIAQFDYMLLLRVVVEHFYSVTYFSMASFQAI